MKKVVLLGDSIRQIGYGKKVPELLGTDYTVWQPTDNCRYAQYTLHGVLEEWKNGISGADIIHWNNGLWDMSVHPEDDGPLTPLETYAETILKILRILKQTTSKIIFATTTPVKKGHPMNNNEIAEKYNSFIIPKLEAEGVLINDLYSLVASDLDKYILDSDKIHLTDVGIDVCANAVADKIRSIAEM